MKEKVLIIAYGVNPITGSEAGVAFNWINILSKYYDIVVYTEEIHRKDLEWHKISNVEFRYINLENISGIKILRKYKLYNILSKKFTHKVKEELKKEENIFDYKLIHCLNPAGIFYYNDIYKLGLPTIIGPIGGGIKLPSGFRGYITCKYIIRQIYYKILSKNIKRNKYFNEANKIIVGLDEIKYQLPKRAIKNTVNIFDTLVDTNIFTPLNLKKSERVKIIYVGRLELLKGCMILLEAFNLILRKGYDNLELIFVGEGSQHKKMSKFIEDNNLENSVKLLGNKTQGEIVKLLNEADIFCIPTVRDNGCGSILEAMACKLPIVTSEWGGPKYSVNEKCGIKVYPKSINQFKNDIAIALEKLINNKELRSEMGKNAKERIEEEFSCTSLEKRIVNLYNEINKIE